MSALGTILVLIVPKLYNWHRILPFPHADYLIFIDADESLLVQPEFQCGTLSDTAYYFECIYDHLRYQPNALISTKLPWVWKGVLREYLDSTSPHQWTSLEGPRIFIQHDSAREHDPQTYLKDIEVLRQGILDEADNLRYQCYLVQSYQDEHMPQQALEAYQRPANLGGWEEERWMAQFRAV
ncbi:hypothetical protein [Acinetobacter sp. ANC 4173]|uniref:hypothetical protein n=1 Tax=Acinetobacter sp. ANC 4173 TaxID=2529837 RepID=UPI001D0D9DC6|nr:hypothetical protein [Acinetobacter sp. ANC 4173]